MDTHLRIFVSRTLKRGYDFAVGGFDFRRSRYSGQRQSLIMWRLVA